MPITDRQRQVLRALWDGESPKEIAVRLGVSQKTIDNHKVHLRRKWRARSTLHLMRLALQAGELTV